MKILRIDAPMMAFLTAGQNRTTDQDHEVLVLPPGAKIVEGIAWETGGGWKFRESSAYLERDHPAVMVIMEEETDGKDA
jgi:hypothetical protein